MWWCRHPADHAAWAVPVHLAEFVLQVEELGLDAFWVSDHPVLYPDCWVALAAIAVMTRRIRLGSLVACVAYRNPLVLARMTADIDSLSNGRLVVGARHGRYEREFEQMPFTLQISGESIVAGTPSEVIAHYAPVVDAGLQYFLAFVYGNDIDTLRLLSERVIPELRALQASRIA